ncbi:BnaA09g53780D [Brassica napus]|uniref:BnaA09g53780D protein n=1 Tax=Brassica napus TaxID=3708 RepID=A0A078IYD0_BRANA|nr:BnaA09g53780D [Brassica napus]
MARKKPSFSQAKEKKKNAASQDSDPPPSSSEVCSPLRNRR